MLTIANCPPPTDCASVSGQRLLAIDTSMPLPASNGRADSTYANDGKLHAQTP